MNDYIIAVDRDGQPYIAHAWKDHKYIAKIKDRYFYTQEQLRAFQQGAKQGFEKGINNKRLNSFTEKVASNNATSKVNKSGEKMNANGKFGPTVTEKGEKVGYNAGKAIRNASNKASDNVKKSIEGAKDKIDDTTENLKARRNVKKLDKEIKEERSKLNNIGNLEGQRKIKDLEIKKLEEQTKYDKSPETIAVLEDMKEARKKQDERIKKIEEAKSQSDSSKQKSKFSEYTKGDKDFDDKNFAEKNRVGDSDFFMAKRPDGSTVILEEDMKWVLPKGVNPNDPAIKRALTKEYKAGSNEEWVKQVTEAIDDAVEEANKKK